MENLTQDEIENVRRICKKRYTDIIQVYDAYLNILNILRNITPMTMDFVTECELVTERMCGFYNFARTYRNLIDIEITEEKMKDEKFVQAIRYLNKLHGKAIDK